jgi:ribosomal protein S18 acetylase RimI-like enzyme
MRRVLGDGFELDDDPARVDVAAVHAYISGESYWGRGRPRALVERALAGSGRVVGLYQHGEQVGFARAVTDGATVAYIADVYVLAGCRGRGLGVALVRELIEGAPEDSAANVQWLLHTADAQGLYAKLGFLIGPIRFPLMERGGDGAQRTSVEGGAGEPRGL